MTLSLANGSSGGKKAFAAAVRFRGRDGRPIAPPYESFDHSPRLGAYFYVAGGDAHAPAITSHFFVAPADAATMEIKLLPWLAKDRPRLSAKPRLIDAQVHQLSVSPSTNAVMLSLANGRSGGKKAFAAIVRFRDRNDSLIAPPYEGFDHSARVGAYFYVAGGDADTPTVTTHPFTAPTEAATMEIKLLPWTFEDRPQLASEPKAIGELHSFPVSPSTTAVTLSAANGRSGGKKAFAAFVRFRDRAGSMIAPPYDGLEFSNAGAYFYVAGGDADAPAVTMRPFLTPANAVTMEIEVLPWHFKQDAQLAAAPVPVYYLPGEPRRMQDTVQQTDRSDALAMHLTSPATGSLIADRVENTRIKVVGILGERLRDELGERVATYALPFDSYDKDWAHVAPTHLVIDATHLQHAFGWEHALTLRDPAATVELAVMLEKARQAGIATVLISPTESHRYPLLSRVADMFDVILDERDSVTAFMNEQESLSRS